MKEKWPVLGRHERAAEWLEIWTNLGRSPRTIDAYARGLAEYLLVCERDRVDPAAFSAKLRKEGMREEDVAELVDWLQKAQMGRRLIPQRGYRHLPSDRLPEEPELIQVRISRDW